MHEVLEKLRNGLIVSCQALEEEPLHSSYIMQRMAVAAMKGGASGIRANSVEDIREIRKEVPLPVIGIIKKVYEGSQVFITPTMAEIDALAGTDADIIATDATGRQRPSGISLEELAGAFRNKYPDRLFMADCATYEDALRADALGFDLIGTTLRGYTEETRDVMIPDFDLLKQLAADCRHPVIAEGGIWSPEQLEKALDTGILAAVVGTAITRPMDITKRFVASIRR